MEDTTCMEIKTETLVARPVVITLQPTSRRTAFQQNVTSFCRRHLLLILTVVGVIVGFVVGFIIRPFNPSKDALLWIGMPGELFMRMLKLLILPLIISSVISGTASLDPKSNGKISLVAFLFIFFTNALASMEGVIWHFIVQPGGRSFMIGQGDVNNVAGAQDVFADLLRNIVPDNMVEASFRQTRTKYVSRDTMNISSPEREVQKTDGVNVLGLIMVCMMIGMAASRLRAKSAVFLKFFEGATDIALLVLRKFFWTSPVGVASLIAVSVAGVSDLVLIFRTLGFFVLTVTVAIVIHSFLILPLLLFLLARTNPLAYMANIIRPCLIGFAATSTAVAIPEMIESCEVKNKLDSRVTRFVIPFCVTLNADGSAIFISAATLFLANLNGMSASFGQVIVVWLLTTITSMALPSVPSSSIVTLVVILASVNIPADDIALLMAVEWFLDRIRTTTNVISHTFTVAITYRFCKSNLQLADVAEDKDVELCSVAPV